MEQEQIVRTIHGSHLYGLDTPQSDRDFKSVHWPSLNDLFLHGPVQSINLSSGDDKSKNTNTDVDDTGYSLVKFIRLLERGEMIAMDMIHTPPEFTLEDSPTWQKILANKTLFYSKDMRAYLGYIRKQVAKYGFKGSRMAILEECVAVLKRFDSDLRLGDIFRSLPTHPDYSMFKHEQMENGEMMEVWDILGKKFSERVKVRFALEPLERRLNEYGKRAILAKTNEGVDWKAVSHAVRACYQLQSLYQRGDMILPLPQKEREYVLRVKMGLEPWLVVQDQLEIMMGRVHLAAEQSTIPDKVDHKKIEDLIIQLSIDFYTGSEYATGSAA